MSIITEKDFNRWLKGVFTNNNPIIKKRMFVFWGTKREFGRFLKKANKTPKCYSGMKPCGVISKNWYPCDHQDSFNKGSYCGSCEMSVGLNKTIIL